jgi:1-acyl-sn-glycerol-3-phosphate acyltransferase
VSIGWLVGCVGGAKLDLRAKIPADVGVLILMNHQSLLDIPIAMNCVVGGYPRIVARDRYRSGYPLVSHMIRLYGHPTVRPGEHAGVQIDALRRIAEESDRAILIYPEGSRTPDGRIRKFKTAGLKAILTAHPWSVYLLVGDGMCETAGLGGFVRNVSSSVIITESEGPFAFSGEGKAVDEFIALMERRMIDKLDQMRRRT